MILHLFLLSGPNYGMIPRSSFFASAATRMQCENNLAIKR